MLAGLLVLLGDFGFVVDFVDELAEDRAHFAGVGLELVAVAFEEVVELLQRSGGSLGDIGFASGVGGNVPEADFLFDGFGEDFFDGGFSDAPGGGIDDAEHRHFVGRLGEDLEIGHQVAGFSAIEEGGGADEDVGDFFASEFGFEDAGLFVGTEEDGDVVGGDLEFLDQIVDVADDLFGFLGLVGEGGETDRVGCAAVGDEAFVVATSIVAYEGIGEVEDLIGAAVVFLEADDFGAGKDVLEIEDVFDFGTAPAIDGLVIVADDAEISVGADEGFDEGELEAVGVLVFVDLDEVEALLLAVEYFGVFEEELVREEEEVVEIDGTAGAEVGLIAAIAGRGEVFDIGLCGIGGHGGGDPLRFPRADLIDEIAGLHGLFSDADIAEGGAGGRFLVATVVDDEGSGIAEVGDFGAEDAYAEGVEGGDPGFFFEFFAEEIDGAFEHFAGGFIGEGDGEDAVGLGTLADEFGHAVRDDARLPGPCSGEDEEGAFDREDGFALGGVEVGESIHASSIKGFTTSGLGPTGS